MWHQGDRVDRLYILEQGQIRLINVDPHGNDKLIRTVAAGEPFGEMCFARQARQGRQEHARAEVGSVVLELDFAKLMAHLQQDAGALTELMTTMCARLAEADRRIEALSFHGAEDRLGRVLLHLARSRGTQSGEAIVVSQSHEDLALLSCMSRSHVSVTMGKLRKLNLVDYGRGRDLRIHAERLIAFLGKRSDKLPDAE